MNIKEKASQESAKRWKRSHLHKRLPFEQGVVWGFSEAVRLVSALSSKLTEENDGRRFGVNMAWHELTDTTHNDEPQPSPDKAKPCPDCGGHENDCNCDGYF